MNINSQMILGLIVSSKEGALVTADFPLECLHTPGCTNVDSDMFCRLLQWNVPDSTRWDSQLSSGTIKVTHRVKQWRRSALDLGNVHSVGDLDPKDTQTEIQNTHVDHWTVNTDTQHRAWHGVSASYTCLVQTGYFCCVSSIYNIDQKAEIMSSIEINSLTRTALVTVLYLSSPPSRKVTRDE